VHGVPHGVGHSQRVLGVRNARVEQDAVRAQLGLPGLTVVDLRALATVTEQDTVPAPAAPTAAATPVATRGGLAELIDDGGAPSSLGLPAASATIGAASPTDVYLVSTEAEAQTLRTSAPDTLVVVWGTEEADRLLRASADFEPSGLRLVDRRFPPAATSGDQPAGVPSDTSHTTP